MSVAATILRLCSLSWANKQRACMSYTMDKDLLALETAGKDQHNYSAIQQLYSVCEVRARQTYFIQQLQKFS